MANAELYQNRTGAAPLRWRELWLKEDWWAIWLGLGIVALAYAFFANGASIKWIAVTPAKWSSLAQLGQHFADNAARYVAQFAAWLAVFSIALTALGHKARAFIPSSRCSTCSPSRSSRSGNGRRRSSTISSRRWSRLRSASSCRTCCGCPAGSMPAFASNSTSRPASCCSGRRYPSH